MESNLILKFEELSLEDQAFWKDEWQKMEEEGDPEKIAQLIQRIREGSKKIKKMEKVDRGRGRNPVKDGIKDRKINPRVHQKSMDKKRLR